MMKVSQKMIPQNLFSVHNKDISTTDEKIVVSMEYCAILASSVTYLKPPKESNKLTFD